MLYRAEHPKPQFERADWLNLNGEWQFDKDDALNGVGKKWFENSHRLSRKIILPFCPESKLSGIGETEFCNAVWYKRSFILSAEQVSGRVVLHFGGCDYETTVYINGRRCGSHKGGYVSFCFDISEYVCEGENIITVFAKDDTKSRLVPSGKQCSELNSYGCYYTRTTGIWQTVWLEFTPVTYIKSAKFYPDVNSCSVTVNAKLCGSGELKIKAFFEGREMGEASALSCGEDVTLTLKLSEKHLWELGKGGLYDLELCYNEDRVKSYFGLRSIDYRDKKFFLNGKSVFQRLVLDQGFYPDGIYTAPSDVALQKDIELSMAVGFNGARLHEKVFEERFLYHADRKGYIVWGEYPNWGLDIAHHDALFAILPEWIEVVERDFNHPSIVGWCPLNETMFNPTPQIDEVLSIIYKTTKAIDSTRPCLDASGGIHVATDIFDFHNYEQDPEAFARQLEPLAGSNDFTFGMAYRDRQRYDGKMPFFVSEYGGIRWSEDEAGWGYGNAPKTKEEFLTRLKGLNDVLLDNENMFALCYTQLTDVEQEQNGIYTYDRKAKFSADEIYPLFARKAKVEE